MSSILPTLGKDVSIDIGSIQTRLMGGTRGTVISEPSIIATDTKQEKVVAVGDEAARLVLRMPDMWRPLTPLRMDLSLTIVLCILCLATFLIRCLMRCVEPALS